MRALCFLALLVLAGLAPQQDLHAQHSYIVQPASSFWIEGSTGLGGFTCEAEHVTGLGVQESRDSVRATVAVPVQSFDCGRDRMNSDLYQALHGDDHPAVHLRLDSAAVAGTPSDAWTDVQAWGTLALAGAERPVYLQAEGRRLPGGAVQLRGEYGLRMTDFGVEPPSGPLGLVRARDAITVRFDLVAAPSR